MGEERLWLSFPEERMAEFPALPLWTDAYLADTRHLSTVEHGAYLLLLMEAWRRPHCDLPDDDKILARLAGLSPDEWTAIAPVVMELWDRDGRRKTWTQKRLKKERDYVGQKCRSQRDKIAKRWDKTKKEDTAVLPNGYRSDTPTPTLTPIVSSNEDTQSLQAIACVDQADFQLEIDEVANASPSLKPEHVAEHWNAVAKRLGKPLIRGLTEQRRKAVKSRIAQFSLDDFKAVFASIERSAFLRGDTGWTGCTFDWVMKPANFLKILEGNYDR